MNTKNVGGKAIKCAFCKHFYLKPCDEAKAKKCPNMKKGAKK